MMWWRQAGFLWRLNDNILFPFDNSDFNDEDDLQLQEGTTEDSEYNYDYDYDYEYVESGDNGNLSGVP
jgi:hypothetical protein